MQEEALGEEVRNKPKHTQPNKKPPTNTKQKATKFHPKCSWTTVKRWNTTPTLISHVFLARKKLHCSSVQQRWIVSSSMSFRYSSQHFHSSPLPVLTSRTSRTSGKCFFRYTPFLVRHTCTFRLCSSSISGLNGIVFFFEVPEEIGHIKGWWAPSMLQGKVVSFGLVPVLLYLGSPRSPVDSLLPPGGALSSSAKQCIVKFLSVHPAPAGRTLVAAARSHAVTTLW